MLLFGFRFLFEGSIETSENIGAITVSKPRINAGGDLLSRINNYVNASETWELNKFLQAADGIITRRNTAIHPSSS